MPNAPTPQFPAPTDASPEQPIPVPDRYAYLKEYISGGYQAALAAVRQALPQYIDDVQRDYGGDVYDRMLTDPAVSSAFAQYKLGILADGVRVEPAVAMPGEWEDPDPDIRTDAELAKEYSEFVQRALDAMDGQPLLDICDELLDGMAHGSKVAEIICKFGTGDDAERLVLRTLKPKKRGMTAYVVDPYGNVLGLIGADPKMGSHLYQSGVLVNDLDQLTNFVPRSKCVIYQHAMRDGDPRGTSVLRAAYLSWFMKSQVIPEFFKYLKQFASPGIIGHTPEAVGGGFVAETNPDGTPVLDSSQIPQLISAEQALMNALLGWINASILVVKGGTEIQLIQSTGNGEAFREALDYFDRQIYLAILGTTRLNLEAKHGSRADSNTAQDVVGLKIAFQKGRLGGVLSRDVARLLIMLNYGEDNLRLAPKFVLAAVEKQDFAKDLSAVATAYAAGFIHESQLPGLDSRLGLPPRDMEAVAREKAEAQNMARLAAGDLQNATSPADEHLNEADGKEQPNKGPS